MSGPTVLVADAVTVFRAAVAQLLTSHGDFQVLEARDATDVEAIAATQRIDLALVDLELPPSGALMAVETLRRRGETEVVVWSFEPDHATVFAAIRAGACGYLNKDISSAGLVRALQGAVRGEAPLSRELMALMIDVLHDVETRNGATTKAAALSSREREVLSMIATGARNGDIASALSISLFTVKRHVQNILHKLEVSTRVEAAELYATLGGVEQRHEVTA
jgi:two-component system nitrate/nitrite response regulator NarL